VTVLDENITRDQRLLLHAWGIRARQIGVDFGRSGMPDSDIVPLLLKQRGCTFFTRDADFHDVRLRHDRYCLVCLDVERQETAFFVRRLLRHPRFSTRSTRMGMVLLVSHLGVDVLRTRLHGTCRVGWETA
jgi:hypothetical protein